VTGPLLKRLNRLLLEAAYPLLLARSYSIYRVGKGQLARLGDALAQWIKEKPRYAIVEIVDSGAYTEPLNVELLPYQTLQIRAAERKRPVIRLLDYMADRPDAFTISGGLGSRFVLDGLLVTGRGILVEGPDPNDTEAKQEDMCDVTIRHSTLVPGWGLTPDCDPTRPNE